MAIRSVEEIEDATEKIKVSLLRKAQISIALVLVISVFVAYYVLGISMSRSVFLRSTLDSLAMTTLTISATISFGFIPFIVVYTLNRLMGVGAGEWNQKTRSSKLAREWYKKEANYRSELRHKLAIAFIKYEFVMTTLITLLLFFFVSLDEFLVLVLSLAILLVSLSAVNVVVWFVAKIEYYLWMFSKD